MSAPSSPRACSSGCRANGKHLLAFYHDVLDLSKIEAGQPVLAMEHYSVADMVSTVLSATECWRGRRTEARSSVARPADGHRRCAPARPGPFNLVGNAIKFTDQGGAEIRPRAGDDFEIAVVDSGPGIAPADAADLRRVPAGRRYQHAQEGRHGPRPSISRRIVELHGGHLLVETEVGRARRTIALLPMNAQPVKEAAE